MNYQTIATAVQEGVATVTLNRPDKRNAMSPRMHEEITEALDELPHGPRALEQQREHLTAMRVGERGPGGRHGSI